MLDGSLGPSAEATANDRPSGIAFPGGGDPPGGEGSATLTGLTVSSVSGEPTRLAVSWNAVAGAAKYSIRWKTGSGAYGDAVETTATSYAITGLSAGTTYTVNVAAADASNTLLAEGAASGTTGAEVGGASGQSDDASIVIYHDPAAGAAAVNRYDQAVALLETAGRS